MTYKYIIYKIFSLLYLIKYFDWNLNLKFKDEYGVVRY